MSSQARQNYAEDCEAGVNRLINLELHASYVYTAMACHFDRDDVAQHGFHKFFKKQSDKEHDNAEKLMKYQNMRGGKIVLRDVNSPAVTEFASGAEAMAQALELEKKVNESMLTLHATASDRNDPQLADYLENTFLEKRVECIKQLADHLTELKHVGTGLGEYLFQKKTLGHY